MPTRRPRPAPPITAARGEQVRATRSQVLVAAREVFTRRGYGGTTIDAVAHRAGVSPQSIYNVVGGKAALLKAVYDVAVAGDDEPLPMVDRPLYRQLLAASDGRTCLGLYARMGRGILERVGPLIAVVFVQGAALDPVVAAFVHTVEDERATGTAGVARHVADRFGLRPGLDVASAADVLWTLTAPELAVRLVHRRRWSLDRFEAWTARTTADALLGPPERPGA